MLYRLAVPFLGVLLLFSLGCGMFGGGGNGDEFALMEFDDPDPTPVPHGDALDTASQVPLLPGFDPGVLAEVSFLYSYQVRTETLQQVNRDLQNLLEYKDAAEVDLEWVVDVHEVTGEADEFFEFLTGMEVPPSQRERYEYLYIGLLEAIQVMGFGSDRLLAASILVGPGGRSLLAMSREETDDFQTLLRESGFYLSDAERLIERQLEDLGDALGQVGFQR